MKEGRALLAGLLLAAAVRAQEDPFADPAAALAEAKGRLAQLGDAPSEESKRWREPLERRIRLLEEVQRTAAERKALPSAEAIESRRSAAQQAIDALRALPEPTKIALASPEALSDYDAKLAEARAARDAKRVEVDALAQRRADADAERKGLPAREGDANRRLAAVEKGDDPLSRERALNARLELRVVGERRALFDAAAPVWATLAPVIDLEADVARLRQDVAEKEQKLAAAEAARLREQEARKSRESAAAEALAAELTLDPVERFRLERSAEAARLRSEDAALLGQIDGVTAANQEQQEILRFAGKAYQNIESRLARGGEGAATLLRGVLDRARRGRQIVRARLAEAYAQAEANQKELVAVLDRLWALELPPAVNDELQALLDTVPADREEKARRVFEEGIRGAGGVIAALKAKRAALERIETLLAERTAMLHEHEAELERILQLVEDRILWIRSDPPVEAALLAHAAREIVRLPAPYAERSLWGATGFVRGAALAGLGTLVAVIFLVASRLRRAQAPAQGAGWRATVAHAALGLCAAALPPTALYGAAKSVRALELPGVIGGPLPVLLETVALLVLVRRGAAFLLRDGGLATALGLPAPVCAQLFRSVRLVTIAALLLRVPAAVVAAEPFGATALPRLLDAAWYGTLGVALFLLVRSRGAIVQELTRPGSWMRRTWGLVGLATALLAPAGVALDVMGYRMGAAFLVGNVARTIALLVALAGFYASLTTLVGRIAARVRSRTMQAEGVAAAWQVSGAVIDQLTRLVAAVVVAVAIVLFLRFWGLAGAMARALESVHVIELADDQSVTLWNVAHALLWIVAGHFVVRNLSAVYDAVVSPLLEKTDAAGRYVFLALSRYAILLVAYGSALLALKVSFSSIGWLLAAVSFGVGFGLQEIVANFVSGLIILLERPVRVGDLIEVDGTVAVVDRINIRSTTVTNFDRQTIIIPNKELITRNLTNWSRNDRVMRRQFRVGVAYGSDVEKVLRALDEEVRRHPRVLRDPPPAIRFAQFGESSLDFDVFFFATIEEGIETLADLHRQVYERFAKEGIEIPFPQRDLHLRSGWEHLERGRRPPG